MIVQRPEQRIDENCVTYIYILIWSMWAPTVRSLISVPLVKRIVNVQSFMLHRIDVLYIIAPHSSILLRDLEVPLTLT